MAQFNIFLTNSQTRIFHNVHYWKFRNIALSLNLAKKKYYTLKVFV